MIYLTISGEEGNEGPKNVTITKFVFFFLFFSFIIFFERE